MPIDQTVKGGKGETSKTMEEDADNQTGGMDNRFNITFEEDKRTMEAKSVGGSGSNRQWFLHSQILVWR